MKSPPTAQTALCEHRGDVPVAAFTLVELLVIVAILALLAATQLPALTRAEAPAKLTECLNNCRRIARATMLYKSDNNDCYPFGNRVSGPCPGDNSVVDLTDWPRQLLRYLGGYQTNVQPPVYVCPSEAGIATNWAFQMHFHINRYLPSDNLYSVRPRRGAEVRLPSRYWLFIEKGPYDSCSFKISYMRNPILPTWNVVPGWPQYRRHHGGMCSVAADASFFQTWDLAPQLALARLHRMGRRNALVWSPHTWNTNTDFHS